MVVVVVVVDDAAVDGVSARDLCPVSLVGSDFCRRARIIGQSGERCRCAAGIERDLLPEILPSASVAGGVTRSAGDASGLREGTPMATDARDAIANMRVIEALVRSAASRTWVQQA